MPLEVRLRPAARRDLESIARYTRARWGEAQAREYVADIGQAFGRIAEAPLRQPVLEAVHPGLRRMRSNQHFVFYLVADDAIDVVRILHERMNVPERLP